MVGNSAFIGTYHSLELVLFVLSSKSSCAQKAGQEFFRDFALCNKNDSNIDPKMGIAPNWIQTLSPNVGRAARQRPSKAAINEPYDKRSPYDNEHRVDDEREIGQGPGNEWLDLKWRGKNEA